MDELNKHPVSFIKDEISRQRILWKIFLCLPIFYLLICTLIEKYYFIPEGKQGFVALKNDTFRLLLYITAGFAVISEILIVFLRGYFLAGIRDIQNDPKTAVEKLRFMFFILACFCDTTSVLGLILFLLNGEMWTMLCFGIIGMLLYAQIYPRENMLE